MIKRIFLYMALMMSLAACSDDIFNSPTEELPSDGKLTIDLTVPEMVKTLTRADDDLFADDLGSLQMLVFDGTGTLRQITDIGEENTGLSSTTEATITVTIDEDIRKKKDLVFYFIANSSKSFSKTSTTVGDLTRKDVGENLTYGSNFTVSGKSTLANLLKREKVVMIHNAVKVTVRDKQTTGEDGAKDYTNYPFGVYNAAKENAIAAGCDEILGYPKSEDLPDAITTTPKVVYVCPTRNADGKNRNRTYVIVKAAYEKSETESVEGYYCLLFQKKDGTVLDLVPNHHYEFVIEGSPNAPGYATPEEAAKNPVSMEDAKWVTIHDHSPKIYNMISDGQRELGVLNKITFQGGSTEAYLYVKVVSNKDDKEENDFNTSDAAKLAELISFDETWVKAVSSEKVSDSEREEFDKDKHEINNEEGEGTVSDYNTKGTLYKIKCQVSGAGSGKVEAVGTVSWRGLSRSFEVVWDSQFKPDQIYKSAKISATGITGFTLSGDYFDMISDDATGSTTRIVGLSAEANNGETRDAGLHFPMPYGEGSTKATYSHTVSLQDLAPSETSGYDWEARFEGDDAILNYVTITLGSVNNGLAKNYTKNNPLSGHCSHGAGPSFTLNRSGQDYEYGVGKLIFSVKGTDMEYTVNLYHTGFFHKDYSGEYRIAHASGETTTGTVLTYYEVVSFGGAYWLDRNLGATSAEMYVETSSGTTYAGNPGAAGDYYRVADYNKYQKPVMIYERDANAVAICPPGYAIPNQDNFDEMRSSSSFTTGLVGNYYTACYSGPAYNKDDDGKYQSRKMVYFPKSLYLGADDKKTGESRSGFYWTSSAASGLEKDEIGNWLKSFSLVGSATSYINAQVMGKGGSKGYAMNVRCISKANLGGNTPKKTSFFVTGATHVFLYTVSKGVPTPITTWPGTPICNYNGVDKVYNFAYESSTNHPEDLKVIFNYKHSNGKIYSMSKNPDDTKVAVMSSDLTPDQLGGWDVDGALVPEYDNYGEASIVDNATDAPGLWTMKVSKKNSDGGRDILVASAMKGGYGPYSSGGGGDDPTPTVKTVTLTIPDYDSSKRYVAYYDENNDFPNCHHWNSNTDTTEWPGETMGTVVGSDGKTYRYCCIGNHQHIIFASSDGKSKAGGNDGFDYQSDYVYNSNGANTSLKVVWEKEVVDYTKYEVRITGKYNNWPSSGGTYADANGIVKFSSQELSKSATSDQGAFRIHVYNSAKKENKDYSYAGDISANGTWIQLKESTTSMYVSGSKPGELFDVEYDVVNNKIKITKKQEADDGTLTIYFENNLNLDNSNGLQAHIWGDTDYCNWGDSKSNMSHHKKDMFDWYVITVTYDSSKAKNIIVHGKGWQNEDYTGMEGDIPSTGKKVLRYNMSKGNDGKYYLNFLGTGAP